MTNGSGWFYLGGGHSKEYPVLQIQKSFHYSPIAFLLRFFDRHIYVDRCDHWLFCSMFSALHIYDLQHAFCEVNKILFGEIFDRCCVGSLVGCIWITRLAHSKSSFGLLL